MNIKKRTSDGGICPPDCLKEIRKIILDVAADCERLGRLLSVVVDVDESFVGRRELAISFEIYQII